jgi:hypothetical protein
MDGIAVPKAHAACECVIATQRHLLVLEHVHTLIGQALLFTVHEYIGIEYCGEELGIVDFYDVESHREVWTVLTLYVLAQMEYEVIGARPCDGRELTRIGTIPIDVM